MPCGMLKFKINSDIMNPYRYFIELAGEGVAVTSLLHAQDSRTQKEETTSPYFQWDGTHDPSTQGVKYHTADHAATTVFGQLNHWEQQLRFVPSFTFSPEDGRRIQIPNVVILLFYNLDSGRTILHIITPRRQKSSKFDK